MTSPRDHFELDELGFLVRWGPAKERGEAHCQRKLCFAATAIDPLAELLYELSQRDDCYFVKLDSKVLKNGMVRGRCFLTDADEVGRLWQQYKVTEHVLASIQDDDFTLSHRRPPAADKA